MPYSQNSNYNNVNVGSFRAPSGGHYSVAVVYAFPDVSRSHLWDKDSISIQLGKNTSR